MRILFVNESTDIKGGVNAVLQAEIEGLREASAEIDLLEFSHSDFLGDTAIGKLKKTYLYFSEGKKLNIIKEKIHSFKPDIIHFHNTYPFFRRPLWSYDLFKKIKVVQHLHNYYPFCLNSFFYRNEKICTECFNNNNFSVGIKNSCYDYSKIKSILATYNRPTPKEWIEYSKNVDLFIGVSQFVVDKYVELGIDKRKIKKLYNGTDIKETAEVNVNGNYVLFLGNIVYSKGVSIVCELASRNKDAKFVIAGLGRDLSALKEKYSYLQNLSFVGYVAGKKKKELLANCSYLLFPTTWWEPFGLVILEAQSFGKFVVTSGFGGTSELVEDGVTGFIVQEHDVKCYEKVHRNLWYNLVNSTIDTEKQNEIFSKFSQKKHVSQLIEYYKNFI